MPPPWAKRTLRWWHTALADVGHVAILLADPSKDNNMARPDSYFDLRRRNDALCADR